MASIKDAFEESLTDSNSIFKYIFYAIPVYFAAMPSVTEAQVQTLISVPVAILLFGFMLQCTANVRNGKNRILPSFNIFSVFWAGLKGIIALAPLVILTVIIHVALIALLAKLPLEPAMVSVFTIVLGIIIYSFNYVGYLLYAHKFKITDAYNFILIAKYSVDVLIAMFFMGIFLLIVNVIITAPVVYFIWLFFGFPNPLIVFYACMVTVFNAAITGHYLAQIDYEIIEVNKDDIDNGTDIL